MPVRHLPPRPPAAGGPLGPPPCWTRTSRTHQAPSAWRAQLYSRPRTLSPVRVRGPCLPLHSSLRGQRGKPAPTSLVQLKPDHFWDFIGCSCRLSYLAGPGGARCAHHRRFHCGGTDRLGQRTGVQDTGEAQRAPEGSTTLRQYEAGRIRMQVNSPTRLSASWIRHETECRARPFSTTLDRDNPQQLGGWRATPATHTGAHRIRATYHEWESTLRRKQARRPPRADSHHRAARPPVRRLLRVATRRQSPPGRLRCPAGCRSASR